MKLIKTTKPWGDCEKLHDKFPERQTNEPVSPVQRRHLRGIGGGRRRDDLVTSEVRLWRNEGGIEVEEVLLGIRGVLLLGKEELVQPGVENSLQLDDQRCGVQLKFVKNLNIIHLYYILLSKKSTTLLNTTITFILSL